MGAREGKLIWAVAAAAFAAALHVAPAAADEIEDAIEAGLAAYRAGDVALAREEIDYAATLLAAAKAEGLAAFLPSARDGWTREVSQEAQAAAAFMGGGLTASANYRRGSDEVQVMLAADGPMIAGMGALLGNPAIMATQGEVRRAGRQRYLVSHDGDVMALIDNRILIQIDGGAETDEKIAYFEAIDLDALAGF